VSEEKDNREREPSGRAGPIRRDSPLSRLVEWIAREVARDLERGDGPESDAEAVSTKVGPALPKVVDTTTKD
jgi:hypothetical protein